MKAACAEKQRSCFNTTRLQQCRACFQFCCSLFGMKPDERFFGGDFIVALILSYTRRRSRVTAQLLSCARLQAVCVCVHIWLNRGGKQGEKCGERRDFGFK